MIDTKEYDNKIEELGLELERDLVVSTAHITEEDDAYFRSITDGRFRLETLVVVTDFKYGWIVYVPTAEDAFKEDLNDIKQSDRLSESFAELFELAYTLRCNHIRLDYDGPISPKLKKHNW